MRTKYYVNGNKVTKKFLEYELGKDRVKRLTDDAWETFRQDPNTELDFWLGGNSRLTIEFSV